MGEFGDGVVVVSWVCWLAVMVSLLGKVVDCAGCVTAVSSLSVG